MSKRKNECPSEFQDKQITKVVKDSEKISHIEFVDKKKKKKGCIFYDCTVAGITPISTGTAGFYKVKNAAFVDDDAKTENMEYPKPIDLTKDLFPCSKKENASVIKFIKSNLYKNKDIMNEEVFNVCAHLVDNYNFEKIINEELSEDDFLIEDEVNNGAPDYIYKNREILQEDDKSEKVARKFGQYMKQDDLYKKKKKIIYNMINAYNMSNDEPILTSTNDDNIAKIGSSAIIAIILLLLSGPLGFIAAPVSFVMTYVYSHYVHNEIDKKVIKNVMNNSFLKKTLTDVMRAKKESQLSSLIKKFLKVINDDNRYTDKLKELI